MKKNRLHYFALIVAAVGVSTVVIVSAALSQNRGEPRAAFEIVSIRPAGPRPAGTRAPRVAVALPPQLVVVR